ncbi:hypothetical protein FQN60_000428, partial [Etheostoma spectabile]
MHIQHTTFVIFLILFYHPFTETLPHLSYPETAVPVKKSPWLFCANTSGLGDNRGYFSWGCSIIFTSSQMHPRRGIQHRYIIGDSGLHIGNQNPRFKEDLLTFTTKSKSYENLAEVPECQNMPDYEEDNHDYEEAVPDYEQDKHDYEQAMPDYEQDK